jgi:hypothetical protein
MMLQRLQVQRNVGDQEHRQRVGQFAHVADGAHVPAEETVSAVSTMIVTKRRGDGGGQQRKQVDDRKAGRDQRHRSAIGTRDEFGQLRHEDQDRQRIDEAGHHRFRHKAHDIARACSMPAAIWIRPASTVAASRYSSPCSRTSVTISTAVAAVAAEIMPGRPPTIAVMTAIENEA